MELFYKLATEKEVELSYYWRVVEEKTGSTAVDVYTSALSGTASSRAHRSPVGVLPGDLHYQLADFFNSIARCKRFALSAIVAQSSFCRRCRGVDAGDGATVVRCVVANHRCGQSGLQNRSSVAVASALSRVRSVVAKSVAGEREQSSGGRKRVSKPIQQTFRRERGDMDADVSRCLNRLGDLYIETGQVRLCGGFVRTFSTFVCISWTKRKSVSTTRCAFVARFTVLNTRASDKR